MFLLSGIPSMECLIHQRKQLCVSAKACLLLFVGREEVGLNDHSCSFCLYKPWHIIKAQLLKSAFPSSILANSIFNTEFGIWVQMVGPQQQTTGQAAVGPARAQTQPSQPTGRVKKKGFA